MSGFDLLGSLSGGAETAPRCSRKGCRETARWRLEWNNPRVHTPERRKVWLACDEHRDYLSHYLGVRGFLKDVVAFDPPQQNQEHN